MNETLTNTLRKLRLSGLSETLEMRLQEASGNSLSHVEFLELILQDELLIRQQRQITRRVKSASFRDLKLLSDFDWSFNTSIPEERDLRLGHRPLLERTPRRAAVRPSRYGKEPPCSGDWLSTDQDRTSRFLSQYF